MILKSMDTHHSIIQSAKKFFLGTLFSRFTGVIRDMVMAFWFGSAPEIAIFMVAYRLANLFRRLFGEGNLQAGFVPHFEALRGKLPKSSFLFYRDTAFSLFLSLLIAVGAIEIFLWCCCQQAQGDWCQIAKLSMWMAPGLLFICLSSLNSSFLRCQKRYFITGVSSVFFNFIWIFTAFWAHYFPLEQAVVILSFGVTAAFAVQWISTARASKKEWRSQVDKSEWFHPKLFSYDWKQFIKPMAVGIIGAGAMQINSALDSIFSLMADPSGPAYLWYAIRIQQLPLALFGITLSGALLPPLSRAMQTGALDRYQDLLETALKRAAILMIPSSFCMIILGGVGLNLLFGRGDFSSKDIQETLLCLWAYAPGVVPSVFVLLFATGFYARKIYAIPTMAAFLSVLFNCLLNGFFVFVFHWGAVSIALATSLSSLLNGIFLYCFLKKKLTGSFWVFLVRLILISLAATLTTLWLGAVWVGDLTLEILKGNPVLFPRAFSQQILQCAGMGMLFIASFFSIAKMMGLGQIFSFVRRKREETVLEEG